MTTDKEDVALEEVAIYQEYIPLMHLVKHYPHSIFLIVLQKNNILKLQMNGVMIYLRFVLLNIFLII